MKSFLGMKEPANTLTHFIAFLTAVAGLVFLIISSRDESPKLLVAAIYGASLVLLYGASSLYHWLKTSPDKELLLRKIDHVAIYILIAGSYTPVFYYSLSGAWRWAMLTAVWVLAGIGIILKMFLLQVPRAVSTAFYLSLGWIALVPFVILIKTIPLDGIILMVIGGVAYTAGALIYATKSLNFFPNRFGFHEIFHLFIIMGSVAHYLMIVFYILPQ
ncbi:MAG: hemolysin III family protein [Firmicutes bacterium]|nr:hemolysin III family protein [Bacillota bacterium]